MATIGNLDTDLRSEFSSAGINQTLHKIYLQIECQVSILTPFHTVEETIKNQVLLEEIVIVGTTPNTYYNFEGITGGNIISKSGSLDDLAINEIKKIKGVEEVSQNAEDYVIKISSDEYIENVFKEINNRRFKRIVA